MKRYVQGCGIEAEGEGSRVMKMREVVGGDWVLYVNEIIYIYIYIHIM